MPLPLPQSNDTNFAPPPDGTHRAICYRVIDLGTQKVEWKGQIKHQRKILISWELSDEPMPDGEKAGQPFTIHQRYTYSSSEKANLRKHLESWRGKAFTEEDFGTFDIAKLIGVPCLLSIVHAHKEGKTYANIAGISRLAKGMETPSPINAPIYLGLNNEDFKVEIFNGISEGLRSVIANSPEYEFLMNGTTQDVSGEPSDDSFEDSIPF